MALRLVEIVREPHGEKEWKAVFETLVIRASGEQTWRRKIVRFGQRGATTYPFHKDRARRERYRIRHQHDKIENPTGAGTLSWYILWGDSTDIPTCIRTYRRIFGV